MNVVKHEIKQKAFIGKTYSLYSKQSGTNQYYRTIKELTDLFLQKCPDKKKLLSQIQKASAKRSFFKKLPGRPNDESLISFIKRTLKDTLSVYTKGVDQHLKTLTFSQRFDPALRTKEEQYHLYMLEIELMNRIYSETFKGSEYKFALIAHCLRDFRTKCRSTSGDMESICMGCTKDCLINLGSLLLKQHNIHPYISVTMDLEKLFKKLKSEYPSIGALGIACIPELVNGMRLCIQLDISPVGIPLDANRCSRWMQKAYESSFNLKMLEDLII